VSPSIEDKNAYVKNRARSQRHLLRVVTTKDSVLKLYYLFIIYYGDNCI
jgi:hypothetical protein